MLDNEVLRKLAEETPGTKEFKKAKAAAMERSKKAREIEASYRSYVPLQLMGTVGNKVPSN